MDTVGRWVLLVTIVYLGDIDQCSEGFAIPKIQLMMA